MPKNNNNNDEIVIKAKDLDLTQLSFSKLEPNENCYGQLTALPKYSDAETPLIIQTHKIPMDFYGVPRLDKFHEDDSKRDYCQIPLNPVNKDCSKLLEVMKSIDDWASTPEFRKSVGLNEDYTYTSIVKTPDVKPGEKTATGKPKIDIPSFKAKFSIDWETKQIDTAFMREEVIDNEKKVVNIKNTQTPDDVTKNALSFKSKSVFILQLIKLWAKPPAKKKTILEYGLQWRILKAKVESPAKGNSTLKEIKTSDKFLDSDDEEAEVESKVEIEETKVASKPIKVITQSTKKIAQIESDDDSDDDEDEKPKSKIVAKPSKKSKESDDDDSDDDDEEEEKPKPKIVAKPSKKSKESDDDEEEEKPAAKPKTVAKTPAKKGGKAANL